MARYEPYNSGLPDMLSSPGMVADMGRRAVQMKAACAAIAPVDSGAYKASLEASSGVDGEGDRRRAYGQLAANVHYALHVEHGTSDTPEFAPLRKSLDAAGRADPCTRRSRKP